MMLLACLLSLHAFIHHAVAIEIPCERLPPNYFDDKTIEEKVMPWHKDGTVAVATKAKQLILSGNLRPGDTYTFTCKPGYFSNRSTTFTLECGSKGKFLQQTHPPCERVWQQHDDRCITITGKIYIHQVKQTCESVGTKYMKISTEKENQIVTKLYEEFHKMEFGVPAKRERNKADFLWLDGTKINKPFWNIDPKEPNNHLNEDACIFATGSRFLNGKQQGGWIDVWCTDPYKLPYICEKKPCDALCENGGHCINCTHCVCPNGYGGKQCQVVLTTPRVVIDPVRPEDDPDDREEEDSRKVDPRPGKKEAQAGGDSSLTAVFIVAGIVLSVLLVAATAGVVLFVKKRKKRAHKRKRHETESASCTGTTGY